MVIRDETKAKAASNRADIKAIEPHKKALEEKESKKRASFLSPESRFVSAQEDLLL